MPVDVVLKKVEDCRRFATAGGTTFALAQIRKVAETIILKMVKHTIKYSEWLQLQAT